MNDKYLRIGYIRAFSDDVEKTRTIEFVASDNSRDNHGTVLPIDKWDLTRYSKNGLVCYMHNVFSSDPDMVIASGRARVESEQLIVAITFETVDLNPTADKIFRKYLAGTLNAVSVYFQPTSPEIGHWGEGDESRIGKNPTFYYDGQELLETSCVTLPSNANALKRSHEDELSGILSEISANLGKIAEGRGTLQKGNTILAVPDIPDNLSTILGAEAMLALTE